MRAEAEEKSQRTSGKNRLSPCSHPALGWLKFKRRAQCEKCRSICTTYSFTCSDCSIVVCLLYKVHIRRQPVESHKPLLLWKVNGAIQDGDEQCFLLMICKEYDPVYLAVSLALSTIGDQSFLMQASLDHISFIATKD
jgi:hypothetical protein